MFLKSIALKNFRCFSNHEWSLENAGSGNGMAKVRKTTILLGDNGTGKSNLLKAIALVTCGRDALSELLGEPVSWIQVGKKFCQVDAVLQNKARQERQVSLRIERGDQVSDVLDRAKESLEELDAALEHTNRNYFVAAYGVSRRLNVNRDPGSKNSDYRHVRAQSVATLFNPDATLVPIESWAMDMDHQKNRGAVGVISKVMSEFLRDVRFSKIDKDKGQIIFKTPLGSVPMNQLGGGYQSVAAWIGDLLYRVTEAFDDYQEPLKTRGLLLIDEVDLHLHPRWQRELLAFLHRKLPNFQVIATTHSPITAQQAGENELYYLERHGKSVQLNQFAGVPKTLLLHQLVMSDAFGLKSDESAELQKKKARYEKLCSSKKLGVAQKKEMKKLENELVVAPATLRSNVQMAQDQLDLLKTIQKELEDRQS